MTVQVVWNGRLKSLPDHRLALVAFPGVGDLGKTVIDAVREMHSSEEVARLFPPGMPPIAKLDDDGLLTPPHLSLHASTTSTGEVILTLTGTAQPNEPSQQTETAREIMQFFHQQGIDEVLVVVGMTAEPTRKETFLIASDADHRFELEQLGVDVRRDEPKGGAFGVSALLASMGPLFGIHTSCVVTTSVGASRDIHGAKRCLEHLEQWFNLGLKVPMQESKWLKEKLLQMAPSNPENLVAELTSSHDAFYM